MNNTSMSFIAHQLNNPSFLKELVAEPVGMEIDVAYSNAKKVWIIAHHDYDNAEHISLESWLVELKKSLNTSNKNQLKALWLDIKTPAFDLS